MRSVSTRNKLANNYVLNCQTLLATSYVDVWTAETFISTYICEIIVLTTRKQQILIVII